MANSAAMANPAIRMFTRALDWRGGGDRERDDFPPPVGDDFGPEPGPTSEAARSPLVALLALLVAVYLAFALWPMAEHAFRVLEPAKLAFAGGVFAIVLGLARLGWRSNAGIMLLVVLAVQLNWSGWVDPRPIGDLAALWEDSRKLALSIREGAIAWDLLASSPAPSALALYGTVISVVSEDLSVMRVLCAALWTVQTWLVWRIARLVSETRPVATLVAALYGLAPAVMVFGALPSVEAVFGVFALGAVFSLLSYRRRGLVRSAALAGFLAGLAVLARPVGFGHMIGLTIIMLLAIGYLSGARPKWRMGLALVGFWVGVTLAATPQTLIVTAVEGAPTPGMPAVGAGFELYIGSDRDSAGAYSEAVSPAAYARVGDGSATPIREADARAAAAAWRRVLDDPLGMARFYLVDKMKPLWASHRQLMRWSVNSPGQEQSAQSKTILGRFAPAAIDGVMLAAFLAGLLGALRLVLRGGAVRDPSRWILLLVAFLCVAAVVNLLEARDRNAFALLPFLALIAPMATARMPMIVAQPVIELPPELREDPAERPAERPAQRPIRRPSPPARPAALAAGLEAAESPNAAQSVEPVRRGDLEPNAQGNGDAAADGAVDPAAPADERLARALAGMSKPKRRGDSEK